MTDSGPDVTSYERIREQIIKEYAKLHQEKANYATQQTRFRQVCQTLPPELRPIDDGWLGSLAELLQRAEKAIDGMYRDLGFPIAAYQDSLSWVDVNRAAAHVATLTDKIHKHGGDVDTFTNGVSKKLVVGKPYPSSAGGPAYAWTGRAATNYRAAIPRQRDAGDRVALIGIRASGAVSSAGINAIFLFAALLVMIVVLVLAIRVIISAMMTAAAAIAWIASTGVGFVVAIGIVIGLRIFWRNLVALFTAVLSRIYGAVIGYLSTEAGVRMAIGQQLKILRDLLNDERAGTAVQPSAFAPDGRWPNPTRDAEFPHMEKVNGKWKIATLDTYEPTPDERVRDQKPPMTPWVKNRDPQR